MTKYFLLITILFISCNNNFSEDDKINNLINKMSIEEKIGQMTQLTLGFKVLTIINMMD